MSGLLADECRNCFVACGNCPKTRAPIVTSGLPPLDVAGILWVAAIDVVPIGERGEWVARIEKQVEEINAFRVSFPSRGEDGELPDPPGAGWAE